MLIDTSGLLCLHHAGELEHAQARALFDSRARKVTHSYIAAEFVALSAARGLPREAALEFIGDLQDSSEVEMIWVGEALHRRALELLGRRLDKSWSLCDGVSFALMDDLGLSEALTTDHHFEQAGFARLL